MDRKVFQEQGRRENLENFSQRCLTTKKKERRQILKAVDQVVSFLKQNFSGRPKFSVARVIKAGSLGKGTAVRNSADIDLVVYFNGLDNIYDLIENRENLLDTIEKDLKGYPHLQNRATGFKKTPYSIQFVLDGDHDVDVLPAFYPDPLKDVADTMDSKRMYEYMTSVAKPGKVSQGFMAKQFSASLSFLQIEFVGPVPESVKKVIRLVKKWKKENSLDALRSYTVELITIHTDQAAGGGLSTDALFKRTLTALKDIRTMSVYFEKYYRVVKQRDGTAVDPERLWSHTIPYVIDVANPFNNLLHRVDTSGIITTAIDTLRKL